MPEYREWFIERAKTARYFRQSPAFRYLFPGCTGYLASRVDTFARELLEKEDGQTV